LRSDQVFDLIGLAAALLGIVALAYLAYVLVS
jgi:hypothetical protein